MKKIFISSFLLSFMIILGCENVNSTEVFEIKISNEEIEAPFEKRDNGKFSTLLRNSTNESISWNLALVTNPGSVLENSQDLDFCEGVIALRSGKVIKEWTVINKNYSAVTEASVSAMQDDHPNFVSYTLPRGTYILMLADPQVCTKDNYKIFEISNNYQE